MAASSQFGEWWLRAACTAAEPDLFFPIAPRGTDIAAAKRVCYACPVMNQCLEYAISTGQVHGIWGGATEDERRLVRIRQRKAESRRRLAALS
jgi:WhiB family redox-sensing transcriptional regulator